MAARGKSSDEPDQDAAEAPEQQKKDPVEPPGNLDYEAECARRIELGWPVNPPEPDLDPLPEMEAPVNPPEPEGEPLPLFEGQERVEPVNDAEPETADA